MIDIARPDINYPSASDTTSINSAITAYRYENGRRYHAYKDGAYWYYNRATFYRGCGWLR